MQEELFDSHWKNILIEWEDTLLIETAISNLHSDKNVYLTTVIKLPIEIQQKILEEISEIREKYPGHLYYSEGMMHITLIALSQKEISSMNLVKVKTVLSRVLSDFNSFNIRLKGVGVSRTSGFIGTYYENNVLGQIKAKIISELKKEEVYLDYGFIDGYVRGFAWSNFMRFKKRDLRILGKFKTMKNIKFGHFRVNEITLATTDKFFSKEKTKILEVFKLG